MNIQQFLAARGLLAESIDANALIGDFISEMEKGLASRVSSLAMIPTYISADREIPTNEPVIVIDAGGTNFWVVCISFDYDNHARIEAHAEYPMPGSKTDVSAAEFFNRLLQYL